MIEVNLLLSDNGIMLRPLAQQRMTLSDLQWPFHIIRIARYFRRSLASCFVITGTHTVTGGGN